MGEIDNIVASGGEIRTRADNASVAAKDLTRVANGVRYGTIPAPVGYDLLGNVKVLPWYVREATGYLPRGLERSHQRAGCVRGADVIEVDRDERLRIGVVDIDLGQGEGESLERVDLAEGALLGVMVTAALRAELQPPPASRARVTFGVHRDVAGRGEPAREGVGVGPPPEHPLWCRGELLLDLDHESVVAVPLGRGGHGLSFGSSAARSAPSAVKRCSQVAR